MLKKTWEYLLLTMGVTPRGVEHADEDKWAAAKKRKEEEKRARLDEEMDSKREGNGDGGEG